MDAAKAFGAKLAAAKFPPSRQPFPTLKATAGVNANNWVPPHDPGVSNWADKVVGAIKAPAPKPANPYADWGDDMLRPLSGGSRGPVLGASGTPASPAPTPPTPPNPWTGQRVGAAALLGGGAATLGTAKAMDYRPGRDDQPTFGTDVNGEKFENARTSDMLHRQDSQGNPVVIDAAGQRRSTSKPQAVNMAAGNANQPSGPPAGPSPATPPVGPPAGPAAGGGLAPPAGGSPSPEAPPTAPEAMPESPESPEGGGWTDQLGKMLGGGDWSKALGQLQQGNVGEAWGNTPGYGKLGLGVGGGLLLMMLLKRLFGQREKYSEAQVKQAQVALSRMPKAKIQGELAALKAASCCDMPMAPSGSRISKGKKQTSGKFERGHQFQGSSTKAAAINWSKLLSGAKGVASHPAVQHGLMPGAGAVGSMALANQAGFNDPESLGMAGLGGYAMFSPLTAQKIDQRSAKSFEGINAPEGVKRWVGRAGGYGALAAGKAGLIAAPAILRGAAGAVQHVQGAAGNLNEFSGELVKPQGGWWKTPGGSWEKVKAEDMPKYKAMAAAGQGEFSPDPTAGQALAGAFGQGNEMMAKGKDIAETMKGTVKDTGANAVAAASQLNNASKNVGALSETAKTALPDAAVAGAKELGHQFQGFNDLAATASKMAPWALGGGLALGGGYLLHNMLKGKDEEEEDPYGSYKYGSEKEAVFPLIASLIGAARAKDPIRGAASGALTGIGADLGLLGGLGVAGALHHNGTDPYVAYPAALAGGAALGGLGGYYGGEMILPKDGHRHAHVPEDQEEPMAKSALAVWLEKRAAMMTGEQRLARARRIQRLRVNSNRGSFEEEETTTPSTTAKQYGEAMAQPISS